MSSVAGPLSAPSPRLPGGGALSRSRATALAVAPADALVCAGVAFAVAGVAFGASGGTQLARTTYTEALMMGGGALLVAAALLLPHAREQRLRGGWTLAGLAALTALTALSITWSLSPGDSWLEANRMLAYLAVFAGGLAMVRMGPDRWPGMVGGVALGCVAVAAWALLTKVFPGALAADETFARLRAPFDYWNAIGLTSALAVPPLLWLASKRSGNLALNALAYPGLGIVFVALMLSYSRGALLALLVGLVFWFAVVPLRLRAATALVVSALVAALVIAWAFSREGLTADAAPLLVRTEVGHELGLLLALMVGVLLAIGLAIGFAAANRSPTLRTRRLAGRAVAGVLVLAAIVGLGVLAGQPGGIDGQVSKGWRQLTDAKSTGPANTPGRLTATASLRARYWSEAADIWEDHKAVGAGAGSFPVARTRYRTEWLEVRQAHGYVVETLAGLGLAGLALSLALLAAWLASAIRTTGLTPSARPLPMDAERVGMLTLVAVVLVFGVHSLIDWTWLVPGTATVALLCAAWVAGRGPLRARMAGAPALAALPRRPGPLRGLIALAVLVLAVAGAWAAAQPLRAQHAGDRAFERLDAGEAAPALDIAHIATRRDPLSVEPMYDLAAIQDAVGRSAEAEETLERVVEEQPARAESWRRLGEYRALQRGRPQDALAPLRAAYYLDPESPETQDSFLLLRRQLAATGTAAP